MCDENDLAQWARSGLTRRRFGALGAAGAVAACVPVNGDAVSAREEVSERPVSFATQTGTLDGIFYHREGAEAPAVLFWPDIAGIRPAKQAMARRLAESGYAVLLANPYYRDAPAPQFADFADFAGNGGFAKVEPWRKKLTAEAIMRDTAAAVGWLDQQAAVDTSRGVGTQGYCMSGSFTLWGAAAVPARIRGAASFHGGGLVKADDPMSPHRMFARSRASHLIAIAQNDDAKAPGDKTALRAAADAADRPAEIEVYVADHGWCVPDSPSYDQAEAERAWGRLLALYGSAL